MKGIRKEEVLNHSGYIPKIEGRIPYLREGYAQKVRGFSITGDAPKTFIRVYEYGVVRKNSPKKWPKYIAKVGHKWYPNESITEQLFTELGKLYRLNIAESKLAMASDQLRFLSKYFLKKNDRLVHGAEIYASYLNDDLSFVHQIEEKDMSRDFFTVSFTIEALKHAYPKNHEDITCDFLKMLTFDAITGNNDRHFYNWGVIENIKGAYPPKFSPIFDTARGLFWNYPEEKIREIILSGNKSSHIRKYSKNSSPKIGIENEKNINHFKLIQILANKENFFRDCINEIVDAALSANEEKLFNEKFRYLISHDRVELIQECLSYRKSKLKECVN